MGINQLTGDIGSDSPYRTAIVNVMDILNEHFGLHLLLWHDWNIAHHIAEEMHIRFDKDGNII